MMGEDAAVDALAASLTGPALEGDNQYRQFMTLPELEDSELEESESSFTMRHNTPGPVHAHQYLPSPSFSPQENALIPATQQQLVFGSNDKRAFLENVRVIAEKRATCTHDHLMKQCQCLAHAVFRYRNIKPTDTVAVITTEGKENLYLNTVTFGAYLTKLCITNLKKSKRNAKKDNQDKM
jgi:hypothetical protein